MDDNNLLMIVLAFVVGFMLQGMMKNMCGRRSLVEGAAVNGPSKNQCSQIQSRIKGNTACNANSSTGCMKYGGKNWSCDHKMGTSISSTTDYCECNSSKCKWNDGVDFFIFETDGNCGVDDNVIDESLRFDSNNTDIWSSTGGQIDPKCNKTDLSKGGCKSD